MPKPVTNFFKNIIPTNPFSKLTGDQKTKIITGLLVSLFFIATIGTIIAGFLMIGGLIPLFYLTGTALAWSIICAIVSGGCISACGLLCLIIPVAIYLDIVYRGPLI